MPRILAAFDARRGDARTNMSTYVQLNTSARPLRHARPTASSTNRRPNAWFDPWYVHLTNLGVTFQASDAQELRPDRTRRSAAAPSFDRAGNDLDADADIEPPDFVDVHPTPAPVRRCRLLRGRDRRVPRRAGHGPSPRGSSRTRPRRRARPALRARDRALGHAGRGPTTVAQPEHRASDSTGYATTAPPQQSTGSRTKTRGRRNPLNISTLGQREVGPVPDAVGHPVLSSTPNSRSCSDTSTTRTPIGRSRRSIRPGCGPTSRRLDQDGYVSMMSVDIGDWSKKSQQTGKTRVRILAGRTRARGVAADHDRARPPARRGRERPAVPTAVLVLDRPVHRVRSDGSADPQRRAVPHSDPEATGRTGPAPTRGTRTEHPSRGYRARRCARPRRQLRVWQAGHGGYQVHFDKLVFAGTWTQDLHAHDEHGGGVRVGAPRGERDPRPLPLRRELRQDKDPRAGHPISWRMPYGFVDQDLSESGPAPDTGRRLLLHLRLREPRAWRSRGRPACSTANTSTRASPIRGRSPGWTRPRRPRPTPIRSPTSPTTWHRSCSSCANGGVSSRRCSPPHRRRRVHRDPSRALPARLRTSGCTASCRPPRRRRRAHPPVSRPQASAPRNRHMHERAH